MKRVDQLQCKHLLRLVHDLSCRVVDCRHHDKTCSRSVFIYLYLLSIPEPASVCDGALGYLLKWSSRQINRMMLSSSFFRSHAP